MQEAIVIVHRERAYGFFSQHQTTDQQEQGRNKLVLFQPPDSTFQQVSLLPGGRQAFRPQECLEHVVGHLRPLNDEIHLLEPQE